ncbi:MAG: acetate/propionate family kinase [Ferruginibacter sp.]|nr:acetate/propionate family kinase [Ferruginibacter sp.]
MKFQENNLFIINGGSSSIKFTMYKLEEVLTQILSGSIENINSQNTTFSFTNIITEESKIAPVKINNFEEAANYLLDWLELQDGFAAIKAIGHRIVHGMQHTRAEKISVELLNELQQLCLYDPEHLPGEIKLIEIFTRRHPTFVQVACFDTAFHTTMPRIAKLLPIPRKYFDMGIQRYGFHGLSYTYLMQELQHLAGNETANGKIILAHLGNGASIAAVKNGKCVDTSMGFTPTSGLVMGTRTGDLDPGVAWYLMDVEKLLPEKFSQLINHESGLLGISETSSDMKELIKNKNTDTRAAEAFELFCYQAKKFIGAYTAALKGLDTLIFSGGIGEHSPEVRSQICDGFDFLGIELCEIKNTNNEILISAKTSKVAVYVIKTNEELIIAKLVCNVLEAV